MKRKKTITITPIRKATEEELKGIPPLKKGETLNWTIGISHLPEKGGKAWVFFPTYSYNVIKKHREHAFEFVKAEYIKERAIKMLTTTQADFDLLRLNWLQSELKEIDRICNISETSRSDKIEVEKYRNYVNNELKPDKPQESEPIISTEYSGLIYDKYHAYFNGESKEHWNRRFLFPDASPIEPISFSNELSEGSNRSRLIAILSAIQVTTGNYFPYAKFAKERFGINNYRKAKYDQKEKELYNKTIAECQRILKK
jgi:hypothetical protein